MAAVRTPEFKEWFGDTTENDPTLLYYNRYILTPSSSVPQQIKHPQFISCECSMIFNGAQSRSNRHGNESLVLRPTLTTRHWAFVEAAKVIVF